jgi:hypothetical protein
MNALYFIVVFFINAQTGEIVDRKVEEKPMPIMECVQKLTDRGPVKVVDGLAQASVCMRVDTVNGYIDT